MLEFAEEAFAKFAVGRWRKALNGGQRLRPGIGSMLAQEPRAALVDNTRLTTDHSNSVNSLQR